MKYVEEKRRIIENASSLVINSKHPITRFLTSMELSFALTVSGEYINLDGKLHVI